MNRVTSVFLRFLGEVFVCFAQIRAPESKKKCAIFKPDGIGDFVLSSEAIRRVIEHHGEDAVCLIVSHQVSTLSAKLFPGVETLAIVPGHAGLLSRIFGLRGLFSVIQRRAYEQVICLRHYRTAYEEIILRAIRADRVILLRNQSRVCGDRANHNPPMNFIKVCPDSSRPLQGGGGLPREWTLHSLVLSASLGRHVGVDSMLPNWDGCWAPQDNSQSFMLVSPLAGSSIRDLPSNLVEAATLRAAADGLKHVVFTGSRGQAERLSSYAEKLTNALPHCRVEIAYPADLPAFVDLVSKARVVLTAESSTAHIAAALDKPTLVLMGGGHYGWFAPWNRSPKQVWLTNRLSCFDCNWRCPHPEPYCITGITGAKVMAALPATNANANTEQVKEAL